MMANVRMDNTTKITVGIPVFNAAAYVGFAIQSVLQQTHKNFELLLVDDGSADNSLEIMRSFNDGRVRVLSDGKNRGLVYRLNEMVSLAKSDFFCRMDADDVMHPERLARQLECLTSRQADVVYTDAISIDNHNKVLGYKRSAAIGGKSDVLTGLRPMHPTILGRLSFFLQNPYDGQYVQMEDWELWYRTVEKYKFVHLPEPLLFYREDSTPTSAKHRKMYAGLKRFKANYRLSPAMLLKSRLKLWAYVWAERFGQQQLLLNRRFSELTASGQQQYQHQLNEIIHSKDAIL